MKKYEVLKKDGYTGLTVGAHVLAPGAVFTESQWPYSEDVLKGAIKDGRCKEVTTKKDNKEKKADDK